MIACDHPKKTNWIVKKFQALLYYLSSFFLCFLAHPSETRFPDANHKRKLTLFAKTIFHFHWPVPPEFWIGMFAKYFRQPEETIRKIYACCWPKTNSWELSKLFHHLCHYPAALFLTKHFGWLQRTIRRIMGVIGKSKLRPVKTVTTSELSPLYFLAHGTKFKAVKRAFTYDMWPLCCLAPFNKCFENFSYPQKTI